MIGKKNVVFGCIFFIFTASLGIWMVDKIETVVTVANDARKTHVGDLKNYKIDNYEKDLEKMTPEEIAKAAVDGTISINDLVVVRQDIINNVKAGPHAHGNLESLLNIVIGILLCFLSVSRMFKQLISWSFIVGTALHSGLLFLMVLMMQIFGMAGDSALLGIFNFILGTGAGPGLLLLGLLLTAVAAIMGFRGEIVKDD